MMTKPNLLLPAKGPADRNRYRATARMLSKLHSPWLYETKLTTIVKTRQADEKTVTACGKNAYGRRTFNSTVAHMSSSSTRFLRSIIFFLWVCIRVDAASAEEGERPANPSPRVATVKRLSDAVSPARWHEIESSVDKGLAFLASQQADDGSFPTIRSGQPGVTSLCIMAFLSRGHQPGGGKYGERLNRAIDFTIRCQRSDGLFSQEAPGLEWQRYEASHTAIYNHAIAGVMLGEVYGEVTGPRAGQVKQSIEKGLQFTREFQLRPRAPADKGGWRYIRVQGNQPQADLSITSWQLMYMRSAKNAQFNVPQGYVEEAMAYVHRCFDPQTSMFHYALSGGGGFGASRGMAGAGILSLSLAGQHQTPMAKAAGDWLLAHPYRQFGEVIGSYDKFFYSTYYCSQAMAQLGGHYWEKFFPPMAEVLLKAQAADGSWPPEQAHETSGVSVFGNAMSSALAVLSLTPPYQLLPVYQR